MIEELKALEPRLKQILYGCVEYVQATKAALYLPTSFDLTEKTYEIVTSYRFNDPERRLLTSNDDLVDWLVVKRVPFFVNGLGTDQRFAEMLFRQGTDRLLAAPLFARGRMIGLIDMRDKAGKKPFEKSDMESAARIADEVLALLAENNFFGLAPIKLVEEPATPDPKRAAPPAQQQPAPRAAETPAMPPPPVKRAPASPEAMRAIAAAREAMSRPAAAGGERATDRHLEVLRLALPSALAMPGAVAAALSRAGSTSLAHAIVATAPLSPDGVEALQSHLRALLRVSDARIGLPQLSLPFGNHGNSIAAGDISAIQSAPIHAQLLEGVVLTAVFQRLQAADAARAMQLFVRAIEPGVRSAATAIGDAPSRDVLAAKLLEPDFAQYSDLAEHCRQVAELSYRFAVAIDLPPVKAETVRVAGLVHDVGLRLLDYEQLYRNPDLTPEQMRVIAEHPIVGAAMVASLMGNEIAQAVLRHHERIDGKGYPSRIAGNQIPLAARMIQIVDAWLAMTSPVSYQATLPAAQAIERLREGAGTQFDEQLVERFIAALPQLLRVTA